MSTREAARVFGLHRDTVCKMLEYSVPPGYRRQSPPRRPKLDPYHGVIDRILEEDRRLPKKQRHTAKRIYERLSRRPTAFVDLRHFLFAVASSLPSPLVARFLEKGRCRADSKSGMNLRLRFSASAS